VPGALATAARKAVRPAKPAGSPRGLGAVAAVTQATGCRLTTGEPPGRGHHAVAPLWRLSRHRGEPWISAPSWWQHDRAATVHRRDRRGRCAGIGPLGDEVAAERVARCQPLATPASDGQGAPVRFARVRFAASRFARARPPGRACGSGAQLRPQPGHRGAVAALASPRRALSGEGSVRGQNSNVIYPGQRPGRVLSFLPPEAEKAWSEARSAHCVAGYTAAKMMCLPGHKGLKDRRAVCLVAAARHGQDCPWNASEPLTPNG